MKHRDPHLNNNCLPYSHLNSKGDLLGSKHRPIATAAPLPPEPPNIRLARLMGKEKKDLPPPIPLPPLLRCPNSPGSTITARTAKTNHPGYKYLQILSASPPPHSMDGEICSFLPDLKKGEDHYSRGLREREGLSRSTRLPPSTRLHFPSARPRHRGTRQGPHAPPDHRPHLSSSLNQLPYHTALAQERVLPTENRDGIRGPLPGQQKQRPPSGPRRIPSPPHRGVAQTGVRAVPRPLRETHTGPHAPQADRKPCHPDLTTY